MLRSALLFVLVGTATCADWDYNRCDKAKGPSAWSGACQSGKENTPINLCGAIAFPSGAQPTLTPSGYNTDRKVKLLNTGYALQVDMADTTATLTAGTLATTVGRGGSGTPTWILGQMHLHYGRTGKLDEGSEHYLQGKAYPAEAHFVHYNSQFATSVATAVASGRSDALLVVGVFLEVKSSEASVLTAMAVNAKWAKKTSTELSSMYKLSELFDGTGDFYSYAGGLTTPTCNEQVTWIVMKEPKGIVADSLQKFKEATTSPSTSSAKFAMQASEVQGKYGTFRPLQNINARKVYFTGSSSGACAAVTEPTFTCSTGSGLLVQPSILIAVLALFSFFIQH